jgi:hypothetical protein
MRALVDIMLIGMMCALFNYIARIKNFVEILLALINLDRFDDFFFIKISPIELMRALTDLMRV